MTEAEWLTSEDPFEMLALFKRRKRLRAPGGPVSDRKLRLFVVACFRDIWDELLADEHQSVDASEGAADGTSWPEGLSVIWPHGFEEPDALRVARVAAEYIVVENIHELDLSIPYQRRLATKQAHHLRDIFGNPFRPAAFDPAWRTDTALSLARGMYDSRDFGAMPILADALQDASCDNADVLHHCRDPKQVHVRGCWVVDQVLGKE